MNNIENLKPFKRICMTIGNLPTAYLESMSYYECLTYMYKYLENQVIPVVNNNTEVLKELQDYIANYFDNLDVQEEINNKLDDMAENGELVDIISAYLQMKAIICFDTVSDMKNAENLADGSYAKTLGLLNYLDGKGEFYKIRTMTISDVVDEVNIIALTNSDTLIAEKIPNYYLDLINSDGVIVIGDSYTTGAVPGGRIESWASKVKTRLGYNDGNFIISAYGGTGFVLNNEDKSFLTLLQDVENDIDNKDIIKKIIVLGGYNDQVQSVADIRQGIRSFMTYANNMYPNAKVYVGCVGYSIGEYDSSTRENLYTKAIPSYKYIQEVGGSYLYNSEYILHNPLFISSDNVHPNEVGQEELARFIISFLRGTEYNPDYLLLSGGKLALTSYGVLSSLSATSSNLDFGKEVHNDFTKYAIQGYISATMSTSGSTGKIAISDLTTILSGDVRRFQITTGTLNKTIMCRIEVDGDKLLVPAVINYDGTYVNLLFFNTYSEITEILIPYQEFEVPTLLS